MKKELTLASGLAELMERLQGRNGMKFWYSTKYCPNKAFESEYISNSIFDDNIRGDFGEFEKSDIASF